MILDLLYSRPCVEGTAALFQDGYAEQLSDRERYSSRGHWLDSTKPVESDLPSRMGIGPLTAVRQFMGSTSDFGTDSILPKSYLSCSPSGFLWGIGTG